MNCPLCLDTTLDVTFHAGIELDICPRCRGVWLDRGELERIAQTSSPMAADRARSGRGDVVVDDNTFDDDLASGRNPGRKKRKKSFADRLGDVFEEIIDL